MSAEGSAIPVFGWAIAVGVSQAKHKRPKAKTYRQGRFALRKITRNVVRMCISILLCILENTAFALIHHRGKP
jgi:hypothetical protein